MQKAKAKPKFDTYAADYRKIINETSSLSGEKFEYFIDVRLNIVKRRIKQAERILDFGCGIGAAEPVFVSKYPSAEVYGVDESGESIRAAIRQKSGANFIVTKKDLPFRQGFFDLLYSNGTFHHIPYNKHPAVLKELFRVTKKGGSIFIFENNPYNPLMMRVMKKNPFDNDAKVLKPKYLRQILRDSGFKVKQTGFYVFYPHAFKFLRFSERYMERLPLGAQYFVWGIKEQ
jgi:SAM-dependent methyltransferase